ncbi:hypothetical protein Syun_004838 [Stephania yunnanensis]|uniref:Uncharacterized protein n=1 Tax=Stephania yunnanensis TaxID=152371 RepID=A0AAP0L471_9MAGN
MAKKRKSEATGLDEADRTMYTTFCAAANSLSQLYTQAMNQQKLAFQAGERRALLGIDVMGREEIACEENRCSNNMWTYETGEKLYEWMVHQEGQGSKLSTADIVAYLQNEHDRGVDEPPVLPGLPFPHQNPQHMVQYPATSAQVSNGSSGQACIAQGPRFVPSANGGRSSSNETNFFLDQSREFNPGASNDSSMDMHADTPDPYADY